MSEKFVISEADIGYNTGYTFINPKKIISPSKGKKANDDGKIDKIILNTKSIETPTHINTRNHVDAKLVTELIILYAVVLLIVKKN